MPLTRSQAKKLEQLQQFAFKPSVSNINNEKKRKRNSRNIPIQSKRRKLTDNKAPQITNTNTKNKNNKKIAIQYDTNDQKQASKSIKIQESAFIPLTQDIINEGNINSAPQHWVNVYQGIFNMRSDPQHSAHNAEVDTIGAAQLFDKNADVKTQRFHVLISLLLSSQTKDAVTAQAMYNLRERFHGLTVDAICNVNNTQDIDVCIKSVGFHNKKSQYLWKTAKVLKNEYDSDIPNTIKDLCKLPGIGPKMAYIAMQIAWRNNAGIGVDVHVHRITNLLRWNRKKQCKTPEHTRKELQEWIPQQLWPSINRLFVGFGQTVCKSRKPKCDICHIKQWCPVGIKFN